MKTAEQFLDEDPGISSYDLKNNEPILYRYIKENLIEFAKEHCMEQLEAIKEGAIIIQHTPTFEDDRKYKKICPKSMDNSYPLENIK